MNEIEAEGTQFAYFTESESREGIDAARNATSGFNVEVALQFLCEPDVRLALFRSLLPPNEFVPYFLVWTQKMDLSEFDVRVKSGLQRDEDFRGAVRTHFQITRCLSCGNGFKTLVVDSGDPYPGAPDLLQSKIEKLPVKLCPRCGASLRQLVVKIIGK